MHFTTRELQILDKLAAGQSYKELAYELGIVVGTVKVYLGKMRQRTGLRSTAQAVAVRVEHRAILRMLAEQNRACGAATPAGPSAAQRRRPY